MLQTPQSKTKHRGEELSAKLFNSTPPQACTTWDTKDTLGNGRGTLAHPKKKDGLVHVLSKTYLLSERIFGAVLPPHPHERGGDVHTMLHLGDGGPLFLLLQLVRHLFVAYVIHSLD